MLVRCLVIPESNHNWDKQKYPTSRKEGSVGTGMRKIYGKYWFLPKLVLTGAQWSYFLGQQENLEKNCQKERSQKLIVQMGEVMTFALQVTFSRYTNTPKQGPEVLFYPQWNPGSYVQYNPLSSKRHKCHILQMGLRECQRPWKYLRSQTAPEWVPVWRDSRMRPTRGSVIRKKHLLNLPEMS